MPVMGFVKFERFFRAAGCVTVDRDDIKRYLDFVNDALYDLLLMDQAAAKANARGIIEPWDLPITKGLQECMHGFERIEEEMELRPILDSLAAHPPLDATLSEETEARLPVIFGGVSIALARTFKLIDAEMKAVHSEEWERTFRLFRLLISLTDLRMCGGRKPASLGATGGPAAAQTIEGGWRPGCPGMRNMIAAFDRAAVRRIGETDS